MKIGRIILSAVVAAGLLLSMAGCGAPKSSVGNIESMVLVEGDTVAEISIEGYGTIKAKLFPDLAPTAVENFILLVEQGYYDGLKIHRVYKDNLIQGGSLNGDGTGGKALVNEDGVFDIETSEQARHIYGALCYANTLGKNSAQFFIVNNKTPQDISTYDAEKIRAEAVANADKIAALEEGDSSADAYSYKEKYFNALADMIGNASPETAAKYAEVGGLPLFDGGYTVFGQVYEGFDVLDALNSAEVTVNAYGEKSKPVTDIIITSVIVTKYTESTAEATAEQEDNSSTAEASGTGEGSTKENSTGEALTAETKIDTTDSAEAA